jgi:DNA modification methylase
VWYIPSVCANDNHEAKFPVEVPRRIIQLLTDPGDLVIDCFVGSGTSATAAIRENRNFIGIDISLSSVELSKRTLKIALEERKEEKRNLFHLVQKSDEIAPDSMLTKSEGSLNSKKNQVQLTLFQGS